MSIPALLEDQVAELFYRLAELERRGQNAKRTGKVVEADYEKGLYRIELKKEGSTGEPYLSPWLKMKELGAGKIKVYCPLSIGEQVSIKSESGDLADAEIEGSLNWKDEPRPHNKGGEFVLQIDQTRLLVTDGLFRVEAGKVEFEKSGAGGGRPGVAMA